MLLIMDFLMQHEWVCKAKRFQVDCVTIEMEKIVKDKSENGFRRK